MRSAPIRLNTPLVVTLLVLACAGLVVAFLRFASDVLAPLFLAATLAILFAPILGWLKRKGLPDALALVVMIVGVIALVVILLFVFYTEANQLAARVPVYQVLLQRQLDDLSRGLDARGVDVQTLLPSNWLNVQSLGRGVLGVIGGAVSGGVTVLFFLFTLILLLADSSRIGKRLQEGVTENHPILLGLHDYCTLIQKQYRIQALSNFLSAFVLTVEFLVFRIDFALLWGILAFLLGFIPNVGLIIACLPAAVIAFILYGPGTLLVMVAIGIVLNATMDNVVTPRFMRGGLNLPISVTFISFLFWSWVFGFIGALLAIPATLLIRTLLKTSERTRLAGDLLTADSESERQASAASKATRARKDAVLEPSTS